jgi:long-subunit acyl-CoA synthetase (AMP-forming)
MLNWAISVGKERTRFTINHRPVPRWPFKQAGIALVLVRWRAALGGRIRLLISGGGAA